jgi:hypothetical protein
MTMRLTRLLQLGAVAAAFVFVLGSGTRARANDLTCSQSLRDCYGQAATRQSIWDVWLGGLDCELTFGDCTRAAMFVR